MVIKKLTRKECKNIGGKVMPLDREWLQFIEGVKDGRATIYGIADADDVGCVGMCSYLVWKGRSGGNYYSYVTEPVLRRLREI